MFIRSERISERMVQDVEKLYYIGRFQTKCSRPMRILESKLDIVLSIFVDDILTTGTSISIQEFRENFKRK